MADENTNNKVPEFESNVIGGGTVETKDRGMFDFLGKKEEVEKPQEEVMIATEFEKVKIEEEEHKEDHENKHSLLEKLHRSDSSSSSSSDEEEGEEGEKKKKKKNKNKKETTVPVEKCDEPVLVNPETAEKKGFIEKIKEKLPGQHNKAEEVTTPPAPAAATAALTESVAAAEPHEGETKEKKGILEKIKEKLPGYHSKTDEEKEKEKDISASH